MAEAKGYHFFFMGGDDWAGKDILRALVRMADEIKMDAAILYGSTREEIYNEVKRCVDIEKKCPGFVMA